MAALVALSPWNGPALSLLSGMVIALIWGNPLRRIADTTQADAGQHDDLSALFSRHILAFAIVALGAGTPIIQVLQTGWRSLSYTLIGIILALCLGALLAKLLRVQRSVALLVSCGTAICGGSAIAAVASVLRSRSEEAAMAFACVFFLNAVGLLLFPPIGHYFVLDQQQFGLWAALAIHDTSSVVGAASAYGETALRVATSAKLARALWILPLALLMLFMARGARQTSERKFSWWQLIPWFIPGFLLASAMGSFVPAWAQWGQLLHSLAKPAFALALFLIGLGVNLGALKRLGPRLIVMATALWFALSALSLLAIRAHWIG